MKVVLTVFLKEFRENLRDRRTLFTALLLGPLFGPLLFAGILQLSFKRTDTESNRPLALTVAHAERAPNLVAWLESNAIRIERRAWDEATARSAVSGGVPPAVLLIPEDFGERFGAGEPAPLLLITDSADAYHGRDLGRIRQLLSQWSLTIARLRLTLRGVDPLLMAPIVVEDVDVSTPASRSVLALGTLSYLMLLAMLMGGLYVAIDSTAGERERGSLEPLLTTPAPREQLIYGKILTACAYMLISLVITVSAFTLLLRFTPLERFGMSAHLSAGAALSMILACAPLTLLGASLMTVVAAFTRSYREAQTWLGLVLLVPTLPLIYAGITAVRPRLALMGVPSLSQHFLIMSVLRAEPLPASYVALSMLGTLLLGALLMLAAARLYRREALLG